MNIVTSSPLTAVTFSSETKEQPFHKHCPLCIDSMVHSEQDTRPPAIIFLDMDGVLMGNRMSPPLSDQIRETLHALFPEIKDLKDYHWTVAKGKHLDPHAVQNLHSLIERIEKSGQRALIVLSTAWRNDATLKQHREDAFGHHRFCAHLCGKTAPMKGETSWTPECKEGFRFAKGAKNAFGISLKTRADVIEFWLRDHGFDLESTNFVVVDDDRNAGLQKFGNRFIQTDTFFLEKHLNEAAKVLKV